MIRKSNSTDNTDSTINTNYAETYENGKGVTLSYEETQLLGNLIKEL